LIEIKLITRSATEVARMSVPQLRYTNPTDIPAYGDWDFRIYGAEIAVRAVDMWDVYAAYLENHRRYHSNIPKHRGGTPRPSGSPSCTPCSPKRARPAGT
jgi:hypothetical protein